ncbi:MAG TPA: hypothetical protein VGF88_05505 [Acidobacteriaceae bacterium]
MKGAAGGGGECGVAREEGADGGFVGEDGGGVDACGGYMRITAEDEIGLLQRAGAMPAVALDRGELEEERDGVADVGGCRGVFEGAEGLQGLKVGGKFWPGGKGVGAGEDELGIGERDGQEMIVGGGAQAGMPAADEVERVEIACSDGADEFFGLLLVLIEGRMGGDFRHAKLLSCGASGVRTYEAERRFVEL